MDKNTDTRYRILSAAINIFSQKGYHNTRVDEIVEAAETSKGGVYFYFPSKQDIFLGLVDEFANLLENRISIAIDQQTSGIHRVDAALQACLDTFSEYRKLAKIFLVQAVGLGLVFEEKQQQIHTRFVEIIQTYLDQAIEEGEIEPMDSQIAAYAWMGAINEVVILWIHTGEPDLERALPALRVFLLRSIGATKEQIQKISNE
ncbi:MAG TPA: TetR/AcrR family transcriptional regulator [Chloroflexi bacterium]|nr:TetR/AcrR family transcriptional regulator [Chloroflexota bacterium]